MKKYFILVLIAINCTLSFGYSINIRINGIESSEVFLIKYFGERKLMVDSTFVDETGHGIFSKDNMLSSGIYIVIIDEKKYFEILIGDDDEFNVETDTTELFFDLKIVGASESEAFLKHQQNIVKKQKLSAFLYNSLNSMEQGDSRRAELENKLDQLKTDIINTNIQFITEIEF